jgi:type I restriction enzyme S subunit
MASYPCPKCAKAFSRNCDLTRHLKAKKSCLPEREIVLQVERTHAQVEQLPDVPITAETKFDVPTTSQLFTHLFDILRAEGTVNLAAYNNLKYLIALRTIQKDILSGRYTFNPGDFPDHVNGYDQMLEDGKKSILFSSLVAKPVESLPRIMQCIAYTLCVHKDLKSIFPSHDLFTIKLPSTYKRLIAKLHELPVERISSDILGDAYENVLSRFYVGKDLGQFFTPLFIRRLIINMLNPQLRTDGTFPSMCDPTAGTGGFIVMYMRHILRQVTETKPINWVDCLEKGISGMEIDRETFSAGNINLSLTTGHTYPGFHLGDSLRNWDGKQYEIIATNPPFGVKGIKWEETGCPIKTNNGTALFLQRIVQMLKVGGMASVVFPCGAELFGQDDTLKDIRQMLMTCCALYSVIILPKGVFENAKGISTCILTFRKMAEPNNVMTISLKNKKQVRQFLFAPSTEQVDFYEMKEVPKEYNMDAKIDFVVRVPIAEVHTKGYSLDLSSYLKKPEAAMVKREGDREVKLGDVCGLKVGSFLRSSDFIEGPYPVIGGGKQPVGYHNEFSVPENTIVISRSGAYAGYVSRYSSRCYITDHGISIREIKEDVISPAYLYYILKYQLQNTIFGLKQGAAQPGVRPGDIANLILALPPLDVQRSIVSKLDCLEARISRRQADIGDFEQDKLELMQSVKHDQIRRTSQEVKLQNVAVIQFGTRITKKDNVEGQYPVYGGGDITFYTNSYNREGFNIVVSRFGMSAKCVRLLSAQFFLNDSGMTVRSNSEDICLTKYLGYYIYSIQDEIYDLGRGNAQKNISMDGFRDVMVIVPSLEQQARLVTQMEELDARITQCKRDIELYEQRKLQAFTAPPPNNPHPQQQQTAPITTGQEADTPPEEY